jgi:hypothetical protein
MGMSKLTFMCNVDLGILTLFLNKFQLICYIVTAKFHGYNLFDRENSDIKNCFQEIFEIYKFVC